MTAATTGAISLREAPLNHPMVVLEIADSRHAPRLFEIGLGEGTRVTVIKRGDPSIVEVGSSTFALARELLTIVTVVPATSRKA